MYVKNDFGTLNCDKKASLFCKNDNCLSFLARAGKSMIFRWPTAKIFITKDFWLEWREAFNIYIKYYEVKEKLFAPIGGNEKIYGFFRGGYQSLICQEEHVFIRDVFICPRQSYWRIKASRTGSISYLYCNIILPYF